MPQALIELNELLAFLQDHSTLQVEIIGHTDNVGTAAYNQLLAEKRAGAVAWFLKKRGIEATRLKSSGVGATQPVAPNHSAFGRSQNRRVEIKVISL
jgi:outer membrane protein OmpA-like peptidoglycan-associated protein